MNDRIGKIVIGVIALALLSPLLWSLISGLMPEADKSALTTAPQQSGATARELYSKCAPCHGANGDGTEAYPPLNTISAPRLVDLILGYRDGAEGATNNQNIMRVQVQGMHEEDIRRLAEYISTLKPAKRDEKEDRLFQEKKKEQQFDTTSISS